MIKSDKIRQEHMFQVMKQKHIGLGTDNTTREEWYTQINRDTCASICSHSGMLEYIWLSGNYNTKRQTKIAMINKMCNDK